MIALQDVNATMAFVNTLLENFVTHLLHVMTSFVVQVPRRNPSIPIHLYFVVSISLFQKDAIVLLPTALALG